ncbi:MAG: hypothetical protein R3B40_31330 [Polyangiales bacterium]|nr:hypothetical protein [Myxococcales bacterium]MCB9658689.1 hypothetical protein [Sandaracinaceae bacterium]
MKRNRGSAMVKSLGVVVVVAAAAGFAWMKYSESKQRERVSATIIAARGTTTALQAWFEDQGSFNDVDLESSTGGTLKHAATGMRVGANLPALADLTWTVTSGGNAITIAWAYADGCTGTDCDGKFCVVCDAASASCATGIDAANDRLGLDSNASACP